MASNTGDVMNKPSGKVDDANYDEDIANYAYLSQRIQGSPLCQPCKDEVLEHYIAEQSLTREVGGGQGQRQPLKQKRTVRFPDPSDGRSLSISAKEALVEEFRALVHPDYGDRIVKEWTRSLSLPATFDADPYVVMNEWEAKMWFAIEGSYTLEDLARGRDMGVFLDGLRMLAEVMQTPSISECACPHRMRGPRARVDDSDEPEFVVIERPACREEELLFWMLNLDEEIRRALQSVPGFELTATMDTPEPKDCYDQFKLVWNTPECQAVVAGLAPVGRARVESQVKEIQHLLGVPGY